MKRRTISIVALVLVALELTASGGIKTHATSARSSRGPSLTLFDPHESVNEF
jgi:hypothetical protein